MKSTIVIVVVIIICTAWLSLRAQPAAPKAVVQQYEYKVLPLVDLVAGSDAAVKKIGEMMVHVQGAAQRTDLDVADYQAGIDRLAAQGWEPVTVNGSNYWVFRRVKP